MSSASTTPTLPSTATNPPIDFGRRELVVAWPVGARLPVRGIVLALLLLVLALGTVVVALTQGDTNYSVSQVWAALTGEGPGSIRLAVTQWRLPRALAAVVFGAMLGVSGAIFQTITRNALGSPDIIGFTTGAHTGGLLAILLAGTGFVPVTTGAMLGGLATALLVYGLARRGHAQGFTLIIVGIGVTAMLASLDTWLVLTADLDLAIIAATWGAGSLNGMSWPYVGPALACGAIALALCPLLSRPLAQLDLGDAQAAGIGSRPDRTRLLGLLLGVALIAIVTSVTGPIAFVALAAPQIGRRLAAGTGTPLLPAAAVGAMILPLADLVAQHGLGTVSVPVGVVTVSLGGLYLLFLIVVDTRRGAI